MPVGIAHKKHTQRKASIQNINFNTNLLYFYTKKFIKLPASNFNFTKLPSAHLRESRALIVSNEYERNSVKHRLIS